LPGSRHRSFQLRSRLAAAQRERTPLRRARCSIAGFIGSNPATSEVKRQPGAPCNWAPSCCCAARPAPARNCSPRTSTTSRRAPRGRSSRSNPRQPGGGRTVRQPIPAPNARHGSVSSSWPKRRWSCGPCNPGRAASRNWATCWSAPAALPILPLAHSLANAERASLYNKLQQHGLGKR